jgi:hypothetical protein
VRTSLLRVSLFSWMIVFLFCLISPYPICFLYSRNYSIIDVLMGSSPVFYFSFRFIIIHIFLLLCQ